VGLIVTFVMFLLGSVATVLAIGKEREPITNGAAAVILIVNTLSMIVLFAAIQAL
jgi:hypothetical protein